MWKMSSRLVGWLRPPIQPGVGLERGAQAGEKVRMGVELPQGVVERAQDDLAAPEILGRHVGGHLLGAETAVFNFRE